MSRCTLSDLSKFQAARNPGTPEPKITCNILHQPECRNFGVMECHGHLWEDWEIRWNSYLDTRRIDLFTPEKCVFVWSFNVSFKLWPHVLRQNGLKRFTNHICPGAFHQYEYNITAGLSSIFWSTKSVRSSPTSETNAWWKKRFDAASLVTGQSTGFPVGLQVGLGRLGAVPVVPWAILSCVDWLELENQDVCKDEGCDTVWHDDELFDSYILY